MTNTENEFHLLSELITMDDRTTAQKAETLIWDWQGHVDQPALDAMVKLCQASPTAIEFHKRFPALLEQLARERGLHEHVVPSEVLYKCAMAGTAKTGYAR